MKTPASFETLAVHAGDAPDPGYGGLETPLVHSNAYAFESAQDAAEQFGQQKEGWIYSRWRNPTVEAFEAKVAALEGAEAAVACASGMAAVHGAMLACVRAGEHVLAPTGLYAETAKLLRTVMARFDVRVDFVDFTRIEAVEAAWQEGTRLVWAESPANPVLDLHDLDALAGLCRERGASLAVDNTFATPYHQNPLALGADLVVHSATKAIGGHGDAVGGVVAGSAARVHEVRELAVRAAGGVLSPTNAWLLARGLRTLALRQQRASENAAELARRLEAHPRIERVRYPGLVSHPHHELARRQMKRGFGSMIAFELRGGLEAGARAYDAFELVTRAVSLGDLRTLVTHAASTTHRSMPAEQRAAAGISDGLFRLAVGIEDVEELWADVERAFG
ncbi:MAG: aminotransferase class I/II-fold pyridoxal phosphate-dependent enzyme [Sandaracinus sp.]|nr:aminotransferase class I/II-fold pyridoxal phosphate-dependent enzyme [Sandaracinus sp.]